MMLGARAPSPAVSAKRERVNPLNRDRVGATQAGDGARAPSDCLRVFSAVIVLSNGNSTVLRSPCKILRLIHESDCQQYERWGLHRGRR